MSRRSCVASRRERPDAAGWWPTLAEFERAPELAVLAVLVASFDVVTTAMLMANREIGDDERPCWRPVPPTVPAAENVLRHLDRLRRAVSAYRRVVAPPSPDSSPETSPASDDDFPF